VSYFHYDRLSAIDAGMLRMEDANTHMHIGAVALFEAGPVSTPEGRLRIDRIRSAIDAATQRTPRFRQKLAWIPLLDHPVWVDDERFNLDYHIRHTALPPPGSIRSLKRLTGRLMSQKLDRSKPMWELWVVEGVEQDRFALVIKAHHCMVDGVGGVELLSSILSPDPESRPEPPGAWIPRPAPSGARLLAEEVGRRASLPLSLAGAGWQAASAPRESLESLGRGASALRESLTSGGGTVSATPLDDENGPYRRVDWLRVDIAPALEVKKKAGATLNDVVLACAAGAFGRFLQKRGLQIEDLSFRASIPVNLREGGERAEGNRISTLFAPLPIAEPDPMRRLAQVVETMTELKRSPSKGGWGALSELSDRAFPGLMGDMLRLMSRGPRLMNVYISNVPGPRVPVYLLGARMLEIFPVAPVVHSLAVALFSYDQGVHWGFDGDWDKFPDLHEMVEATEHEWQRLHRAAQERPPEVGRARKKDGAKKKPGAKKRAKKSRPADGPVPGPV
jgi:WS/DGAT/MGAT family acyltransferase